MKQTRSKTPTDAPGALQAVRLRCNGLEKPMAVEEHDPAFSWQLSSDSFDRDLTQTAYQLNIWDDRGYHIYDSGRVASASQRDNRHTVAALRSCTEYRYTVEVWDQNGRPSARNAEGSFVTGILPEEKWGPLFYCAPQDAGLDEGRDTLWYRQELELPERPAKAFLCVASAGIHELYINGTRVGERVFAPSRSNLTNYRRVLYVQYDVTAFLRAGANALGIWLDAGWTRKSGVRPAFSALLTCCAKDGTRTRPELAGWLCRASGTRHIGGMYEWSDFGGEQIVGEQDGGWCLPGQSAEGWLGAEPLGRYIAPSADLLEGGFIAERLQPQQVRQKEDTVLFDMGRNYTGWVELQLSGGRPGAKITIETADKPEESCTFGQRSEYIFTGAAGVFRNRFNFAAGRYITVRGVCGGICIDRAVGLVLAERLARKTRFSTSSALQNAIYALDTATFEANTLCGVTMDCPHRERLGYGETGISNLWGPGLLNYETAAYYRHVFRNWRDVQHANGYLPHVAPNMQGGGGLAWSCSLTVNLSDYYEYTQDLGLVRENYAAVCGWADYLAAHAENGVMTCPPEEEGDLGFLGDWAYFEGNDLRGSDGALFFNNCMAAYALHCTAVLARAVGDGESSTRYRRAWNRLCGAVHRRFYDGRRKSYLDGSQRYLAAALCAGIPPAADKQAVAENLRNAFLRKGFMDGGSAGTVFICRAMGRILQDNASLFRWLQSTDCPSYGYFLARRETVLPETWNISDFAGGSRIHTCFSGISGWYIRSLLGLNPSQNRENTFELRPWLCPELHTVHVRCDCGFGPLGVDWQLSGDGAQLQLTVPPNMHLLLYVPQGMRFDPGDSVSRRTLLGSGSYHFQLYRQL